MLPGLINKALAAWQKHQLLARGQLLTNLSINSVSHSATSHNHRDSEDQFHYRAQVEISPRAVGVGRGGGHATEAPGQTLPFREVGTMNFPLQGSTTQCLLTQKSSLWKYFPTGTSISRQSLSAAAQPALRLPTCLSAPLYSHRTTIHPPHCPPDVARAGFPFWKLCTLYAEKLARR